MNTLTKGAVKNLIIGSIFALVAVFSPLVISSSAHAAPEANTATCDSSNLTVNGGVDCAAGTDVPGTLFGTGSIFTTIVNVLLFIIGAISVIMLIIGGIRYTTSAGDSGNVTAAKNTIMYALIGLIVAFLAFAVVNWVLGAITPA